MLWSSPVEKLVKIQLSAGDVGGELCGLGGRRTELTRALFSCVFGPLDPIAEVMTVCLELGSSVTENGWGR